MALGLWTSATPVMAQTITTFNPTGGGTFSWGTAGNWSNGVPNSANASALINRDITGNTIIELNGNRTLWSLNIGDSNGSHSVTIDPGSGGTLSFLKGSVGASIFTKSGSGLATINAGVVISNRLTLSTTGTLVLAGPVTIGGNLEENTLERSGAGTLTISGDLVVNGPGILGSSHLSIDINGGTTNLSGTSNSLTNGLLMRAGTLNFGGGTGASSTDFSGSTGMIMMQGGTLNIGVATATGQPAPVNNLTIDMDQLIMTGGTLNLRNGSGGGTTTLNLGATGVLTLSGGTTTFNNTGGGAGGNVVIAAGAKLVMNNAAVLNFTSTTARDHSFASVEVLSTAALLRSQAGVATLTIGGDGIDDVFNGQINLASSAADSRLIKIGTETLTLGGDRNNATSRLEVLDGLVVLAKESTGVVAAVDTALTIGNNLGGEVLVRLGGSFVGEGVNTPVNFNDQIGRTATVTLRNTGVLDLNGFIESFNGLAGSGVIRNDALGTTATVIVGDNNGASTFAGQIRDGLGITAFTKTGTGTMTLQGLNDYSGGTIVGRATLQLANDGRISESSVIRVERGAVLLLNNNATSMNDRVNDEALITMDRGTLILRSANADNPNKVISELMGDLSLSSFNVVRLDNSGNDGTGYVAGSSLTIGFASYERNAGGQVAFVERSNSTSAGFLAANPAGSNSRVVLGAVPTSFLVGGGGNGGNPNTNILVGAFGGIRNNGSTELMTVQTVSGLHYVRPLQASEHNTGFTNATVNASNLPVTPVAGPTATWDDVIQLNASTAVRINANTAFNAIRFNGTSQIYIEEDKKLIVGGMAANANLGTVGFDGSGMLVFPTGAVSMFGGALAFGEREAIIRMGGGPHRIYSRIEGVAGLSKSGGGRLDLLGDNRLEGTMWINEGEVRGYTDRAFGELGVDKDFLVNLAQLGLQSGVNMGDGTVEGSSRLILIGAGAQLWSNGQHNTWNGEVLLSSTNAGGQSGQNAHFRTYGSAVLTVNGRVTTAGEDLTLNLYEQNPTQNFTGSGQGLIFEALPLAGSGAGSIINVNGAVSDREGQAATGTGELPAPGVPARAAEHEKLNLFVRGFTGQSAVTNSDFVVNLRDATNVNGRIDLRSGFLFIDSNYGTANKEDYTRGGLIRLSDGGNVDRAGIMAGLLMTQGGTIFRGNDLTVGVADGSHSSNSLAILGGMNRSGEVIIGSDRGTLNLQPPTGTSNFSVGSAATAGAGSTTITLSNAANFRVGYGITGSGISPGTTITAINGNVITLSAPTLSAAASGTSYTTGYFPAVTNIVATATNTATVAANSSEIQLSSVVGFAVGQGIAGPGLPAGSTITAVNNSTNTVTVGVPSGANGSTGTTYSAYAVNDSITLNSVIGLRVGMALSGVGVPLGSTITAINSNTITLSAPLNNAMPLGTSLAFPLARVSYQTLNTNGGTNGFNAVGSSVVRIFDATGLVVGSTVAGRGVQNGTVIEAINPIGQGVVELVLSRPLIAVSGVANNSVAQNQAITIQKAANFVETRLYAAAGGGVDFQMRVLDDGGFSAHSRVGALSKVGRGTVELSGSAAGGSSVDGGLNLFGGTLIFDYINLQNEEGIEVARDNSRISQGTANAPHQLTLAGGTLVFRDADAANITESMRGTMTIRAGNSGIRGEAGGTSFMTLNLGYNNPYLITDSRHYWRAPDRFAGGTLQIEYANVEGVALGGASRVLYSQNAPSGGNSDGSFLGNDSVIPYSTLVFNDPTLGRVVDFTSFSSNLILNSNQTTTAFADASGFRRNGDLYDPSSVIGFFGDGPGDLSFWDEFVSNDSETLSYGYLTDDNVIQEFGIGFNGTLSANLGNDFVGARVIRYAGNVPDNTLRIANGTRLVLASRGDSQYGSKGDAVVDGGAILISNLVSRDMVNGGIERPTDQFISGGSLTSALPSTYFSAAVMPGPYTQQAAPVATSTDLIIHNYNELGVFTIESPLVNFESLPLNLVVSGPGVTKLQPSSTSSFSGAVFINEGTLWVNSAVALGSSANAMIYMNGGTLEIADLNAANRETVALTRTLPAGRPLVIGGNGATLKTTAPGTVVTYSGAIVAEEYVLPLTLEENRFQENIGVGDFLKTGAGRLILTNARAVGANGWNAYYGVTEVLEGVLQLNINAVDSGILGSHYSFLDGTRIEAGGRVELQILGSGLGTAEWFDLLGGTLGTTTLHTDGVLDGVIRLSEASEINVRQGLLRLNVNGGQMEGAGRLLKTGAGSLMLFENNANFAGEIEIMDGFLVGASQGVPLGRGERILLGNSGEGAIGTAGVLLQSRTTDVDFRTTYQVAQEIQVEPLTGVSSQTRVLGAQNLFGTGVHGDTYLFSGAISLGADVILRYSDVANNPNLNAGTAENGLTGGRRTIALRGALSGGGDLRTEVLQTGGTINGADPNQVITFELGGSNGAWTGAIRLGNEVGPDSDRQHILRLTHGEAIGAGNQVTLDFNASLQVAGGVQTIGNLVIGTPVGNAVTNGVFVENAANEAGVLVVNQTVNDVWDVLFRDGITPVLDSAFDAAIRNHSLSLIKMGGATVTMTQANSYTGFTQVGEANGESGGTLRLGVGGSILASSPLTVFAGAFELNGTNQTLNEVVTLGGGAAGTTAAIHTGSNTLTLGNNVQFDGANAGGGAEISGRLNLATTTRTFTVEDSLGAAIDLRVSAEVFGAAGIIKAGQGVMALSGASLYSGSTLVTEGTLLALNLAGSATGTGAVMVSPGATLGGVGSIAGDVSLQGTAFETPAILAPGSPTILSGVEALVLGGALTLGEFSLVEFSLGTTGFSRLEVETIAFVHETTRFSFVLEDGYTPTAGASFSVLAWGTGPLAGDLNWLDNLILPGGVAWDTSEFTSTGVLRVSGVATPVSILSQPVPLTVDPGQSAVFGVTLTGTEPWLLQWQKDGVDIVGATGLNLVLESAKEADEGNYSVTVTNGINTVVSHSAFLEVNDFAEIVSHPAGGTVNPGSEFTFEVEVEGAGPFGFEWRRNGVAIVGAPDSNVFTLTSISLADEGIYTVVVSNAAGPVVSNEAELLVNRPVLITVPPQDAFVSQGTEVVFSVTATGTGPLTYQWQRNGSNIAGATSAVYSVVATAAREGLYRVVVGNVVGNVISEVAQLALVGGEVVITEQPVSKIVAAGDTLTLQCQAVGGLPLRYQWRRNGVNIAGATQATLVINNVTIARGGAYTCLVRNTLPDGPTSELSDEVQVAVVNTVPRRLVQNQGSRVTLSVSAGGDVSYQWYKRGVAVPDGGGDGDGEDDEDEGEAGGGEGNSPVSPNDEVIPGATMRTLLLTNLELSDTGVFYCLVRSGDLAMLGGDNALFVYNEIPQMVEPVDLPPTVVSELYFFQVPLVEGDEPGVPDPARMPTRFVAAGLPPGLRIDNEGRITGRATRERRGPNGELIPYLVRITASNARGGNVVLNRPLMVDPLDASLVGLYHGGIERSELNEGLGGQLTLTATRTGVVTGNIRMGTRVHPFRTVLNTNAGTQTTPQIEVVIGRGRLLSAVTLSCRLNAGTNEIEEGELGDEVTTAGVTGWRNTWVRTADNRFPAEAIANYYTVGLDIPSELEGTSGNVGIPQGTGFATFTVNRVTGRLNVVARAPDGTAFTTASFVGPAGQILIFRTLYAANARGSVLGQLGISQAPQNENNTVAGLIDWWRPFTPAAAARLYKEGFHLELTAAGSRYTPPATSPVRQIVMEMEATAPGVNNGVLTFLEANNVGALPVPNFVGVRVDDRQRAVPDASANTRKVRLAINGRTGAISGRFELSEENPFDTRAVPRLIKRVVSYQGRIIRDGSGIQGLGYFLLPQLPSFEGETPGRTPILSGQVILDRLTVGP